MTVFTRMISKKVLDLRQCSSSIVFSCPSSSPMSILFSSHPSQQYFSPAVTEKQEKITERQKHKVAQRIQNTKRPSPRQKCPPGSNCLFYSVLHAVISCCCRLIGGLATWRAGTCGMVVLGCPDFSLKREISSLICASCAVSVQNAVHSSVFHLMMQLFKCFQLLAS